MNENTPLPRLADLGRQVERRRGPDPYPRPTGPAPSLEDVRLRRGEIEEIAVRDGAAKVRVSASVAHGDRGQGSDVDLLVEGERPSTIGRLPCRASWRIYSDARSCHDDWGLETRR